MIHGHQLNELIILNSIMNIEAKRFTKDFKKNEIENFKLDNLYIALGRQLTESEKDLIITKRMYEMIYLFGNIDDRFNDIL